MVQTTPIFQTAFGVWVERSIKWPSKHKYHIYTQTHVKRYSRLVHPPRPPPPPPYVWVCSMWSYIAFYKWELRTWGGWCLFRFCTRIARNNIGLNYKRLIQRRKSIKSFFFNGFDFMHSIWGGCWADFCMLSIKCNCVAKYKRSHTKSGATQLIKKNIQSFLS